MSPDRLSERWWTLPATEVGASMEAVARRVEKAQGVRRDRARSHMALYGGHEVLVYNSFVSTLLGRPTGRLSLNVVRSLCNAATARIGRLRPKTRYTPVNGDWSAARRARTRTRFVEIIRDENDFDRTARIALRDATLFDAGIIKTRASGGRICHERCLPWEVMADWREGTYGWKWLRNLYQVQNIDRDVLRQMVLDEDVERGASLADVRKAIDDAPGPDSSSVFMQPDGTEGSSDLVTVYEAWHLPSGSDAKDGRHALVCAGTKVAIIDEPWTRADFPFSRILWSEPTIGPWGNSLAEELVGIQNEINYLVQTIQRAQHLLGKPKVALPVGCGVPSDKWGNEIGVFTYSGPAPPQVLVFQCAPPEMYEHLRYLVTEAHNRTGSSEMFSSSQVALSGLKSGKAVRTANDLEARRFAIQEMAYQNLYVQVDAQSVACARELADSGIEVRSTDGERISIKDIERGDDEFRLRALPTNALSDDVSSRIEDVQELINLGAVTQREEMLAMLELSDIESYTSIETAPYRLILRQIEQVRGGAAVYPDPMQNLQLAKTLMIKAANQALEQDAPRSVLQAMESYIVRVDQLINAAQQAAAPAPQAGQAGNAGAPPMMPPEQTELQ